MVYQMPCPGKKSVFVASSNANSDQAHRELQGWAAGNGYCLAAAERSFMVYGHEQRPRKWVLLERAGLSLRSNTGR